MCRNAWCLGTVVDVVSDLLRSLADGEQVQHALCVRLGAELDAAAVAYVQFDVSDQEVTLTCWPHTVDVLRLKVVVDHLPSTFPQLLPHLRSATGPTCLSESVEPQMWRGSIGALLLWEVLQCQDLAQLTLVSRRDLLRLIVIAGRRNFSSAEMHLLAAVQAPLSMVDLLVHPTGAEEPHELAPATARLSPLTPREVEVLTLVSEGLLARTIAARLAVSDRTVHKHLGNVYRKLDTHDRLLAVRRAESLGLLSRG